MSAFFDKVVKNSIWTGIGAAGSAVLNLLFAGLTVRWLGISDAGFVLAVTSLTAMTAGIAALGFGVAAIRYLSEAQAKKDEQTVRRVVGTCMTLSASVGVIIFVFLIAGTPWIIRWTQYKGNHGIAALFCGLMGLTVIFRQVSGTMMTTLEAYQRFDFLTTRNLLFDLLNGLLGIFLLRAFPTVLTAGIITAAMAFGNFAVLARMTTKLIGFAPWPAWDGLTFTKLWKLGRWTYLTSIGTMLLGQSDRVLVTSLFGAAVLPLYTMGKRGFELIHLILTGQAGYLFPMLCAEVESKDALMERIEPKIRWFLSVVSIWLYSTMILVGPAVLDLIVGKHFGTRISTYILIFSIVGILQAQSIVPWNFAYATDRVKLPTAYNFMCTLGILPPMYLLGRWFGFTGAVAGQLGLLVPLAIFYAVFWTGIPLASVPWRILSPMLAPLFFYVAAVLLWIYEARAGTGLVERLVCGAVFGAVFLPLVVRLERLIFPGSDAPATLRRAAERVTQRFPVPVPIPAMTMIFGPAA